MRHTLAGTKTTKPDRTIRAKPDENRNLAGVPKAHDLDRPSTKARVVARVGSRHGKGW